MSAPRTFNKKAERGLLSYFGFSSASSALLWLLSGQGQTVHLVLEPPRSTALGVAWKDSRLLFSSPLRRATLPRVPPAPAGTAKGPRLGPRDDSRVEAHLWECLRPEGLSRTPSLGLPSSLASAIRKGALSCCSQPVRVQEKRIPRHPRPGNRNPLRRRAKPSAVQSSEEHCSAGSGSSPSSTKCA